TVAQLRDAVVRACVVPVTAAQSQRRPAGRALSTLRQLLPERSIQSLSTHLSDMQVETRTYSLRQTAAAPPMLELSRGDARLINWGHAIAVAQPPCRPLPGTRHAPPQERGA